MPPKKPARKATTTASKNSGGKPSALAKSLSLNAVEERQISDAWALFASGETMAGSDVRSALMALDLTPSAAELAEILDAVVDETGNAAYEQFLTVAALKLRSYDGNGEREQEAREAFRLFTKGARITVHDLRRVAAELKEDVTESQLRDMIAVASRGGGERGIDVEEFEDVMSRAGVL